MSPSQARKIIFVTGGVVSSIGKGLAAASIGALMESRGLTVTNMKLDPYLNVDPGTMSPFQHGEVFVTDDGAETDLDLGHYERFTSATMTQDNNLTSGRVYYNVISKEREGKYLGATIQVIPHITDEIKNHVLKVASTVDVAIVEIGGTVGDIESLPFFEAVRQLRILLGPQNSVVVHVTLLPYIAAAEEMKTKPTQHSVKELLSLGIQPDILLCRSEKVLDSNLRQKIANFTNVAVNSIISANDVSCIYEVPLNFQKEGLDVQIVERLNIWSRKPDLRKWKKLLKQLKTNSKTPVHVALVGKYVHLRDAYKSLHEALVHGSVPNNVCIKIHYVDSEELEKQENIEKTLKIYDAILVPGGFGERGIEGKIKAVCYAREKGVPFLGICLGMHISVIEFARHVAKLSAANSEEFNPKAEHLVVALQKKQKKVKNKGATMRLGSYPCKLKKNSVSAKIYGKLEIGERHRHRYEISNDYIDELEKNGLTVSGISPNGKLVEMTEITEHPFFIGCQFHPEFKSKPYSPHLLFVHFLKAAKIYHDGKPKKVKKSKKKK